MPIQLGQLMQLITSPNSPSPYRGDIGAAIRGARQVKVNERAQDLSEQQEQRLAQGQQHRQQMDLGQLQVQQGHLRRAQEGDTKKLFEAYQQALRDGDPAAIDAAAQELTRNGYQTDRVDHASNITTAQVGSGGSAPNQAETPKGGPGTSVSPEDQKTGEELDAMRSNILGQLNGSPAPPPSHATADRQVKELELSPGDSMLGGGLRKPAAPAPAPPTPAAPAPAAPAPQLGGGLQPPAPAAPETTKGPRKLQVRDPRGQVVFETDPAQLDAWREQRVRDAFAPLASNGNEIQTAAARKAMDSALARIGTMPLEKVIAAGVDMYEKEVDQLMGVKRAAASKTGDSGVGGGYGGTGLSKAEFAVSDALSDVVQNHVRQVQTQNGFRSLTDIEKEAGRVVAAIDEKTGVGDLMAVTAAIAALQQRVTDADMRQALAAGGLESTVKNLFGFVADQGRKDPNYMKQYRSMARALAAAATDTKRRLATQAAADLRDIGSLRRWSPEDIERASAAGYNLMLGGTEGRRAVPGRPTGKDPARAQAPQKPAQKSAHEPSLEGATPKTGAKPGTIQQGSAPAPKKKPGSSGNALADEWGLNAGD